MDDPVRAALQQVCDAEGSGWQIAHYVIVAGLERMRSDGHADSSLWLAREYGQPGYMTTGLLAEGIDTWQSTTVDDD